MSPPVVVPVVSSPVVVESVVVVVVGSVVDVVVDVGSVVVEVEVDVVIPPVVSLSVVDVVVVVSAPVVDDEVSPSVSVAVPIASSPLQPKRATVDATNARERVFVGSDEVSIKGLRSQSNRRLVGVHGWTEVASPAGWPHGVGRHGPQDHRRGIDRVDAEVMQLAVSSS
jgi:hypothetical protein